MIELLKPKIVYPDSDGRRMSDNTKQYRWIVTIKGGLDRLFAGRNDVFVAGDLLWYAVEGKLLRRRAPDAMVAFGRPPGDRGSYMQWKEGNIPPQVVFEVLSPKNSKSEMERKKKFYDRYGVEEYYLYDPDRVTLKGWIRRGKRLVRIRGIERGFVSPRLGIHFQVEDELVITGPDGWKFVDYREAALQTINERRQRELAEANAKDSEARRKSEEAKRKSEEAKRSEAEKLVLDERQKFEELVRKLKANGIDPGSLK